MGLKGSFKGDVDIDEDVEVDVDIDIDRCFSCLKGGSRSVETLLNGIEIILVLTL